MNETLDEALSRLSKADRLILQPELMMMSTNAKAVLTVLIKRIREGRHE